MTTVTGRPPRDPQTPDRSTPPVLDREDRACAGIDPEVFFPERNAAKAVRKAKAICDKPCPVRRECLAWALATRQKHGVLGGTTPEERTKMIKEMA